MIDRKKYFDIINLYREENNLNRLVYRLIKFEDERLSFEQICNRVDSVLKRKKELEAFEQDKEQAIENTILKFIEELKREGATDIQRKNEDINFNLNGKSYRTHTLRATNKVREEYRKLRYDKFYKDIDRALDIIISAQYVVAYDETRHYISPYTDKKKIKSTTTRYKAIK